MENPTEALLESFEYEYTFEYDYIEMFEKCSFEPAITTVPIIFTVVVILSLLGNTLVLVILGLYESLKSMTNICILNLAVSDLIFTFGLPFWSSSKVWGWIFGDVMCKGVNFAISVGFCGSTMFLMVLTIQNYIAVLHPMSEWNRMKQISVISIFAWLVCILAASPDLLYSEVLLEVSENSTELYCVYANTKSYHATFYKNLFFVVTFLVMGFCSIRILRNLHRFRTNTTRSVRLIFCLVLAFFVFWAPYNIMIFLELLIFDHTACEEYIRFEYAFLVCNLLAFSHCCLNPLIYVFAGKKFRRHLKVLQQSIFQQQTSSESTQMGTVETHSHSSE